LGTGSAGGVQIEDASDYVPDLRDGGIDGNNGTGHPIAPSQEGLPA
jgi:hypothetical protein